MPDAPMDPHLMGRPQLARHPTRRVETNGALLGAGWVQTRRGLDGGRGLAAPVR
jgi:hypothetical protein